MAIDAAVVPVVQGRAFVTTTEVIGVSEVHVRGFDKPIRVTIKGIKDARTGHYRSCAVEISAPKEMGARMVRVRADLDRIIVSKGDLL